MEKKKSAMQIAIEQTTDFMDVVHGIMLQVRIPKYRQQEYLKAANTLYSQFQALKSTAERDQRKQNWVEGYVFASKRWDPEVERSLSDEDLIKDAEEKFNKKYYGHE